MIRTLRADRASRAIRCNARMPGFIATPKVTAMSDQVQSAVTAQIRLGRFGETDELVRAVTFLLSAAAVPHHRRRAQGYGAFELAVR